MEQQLASFDHDKDDHLQSSKGLQDGSSVDSEQGKHIKPLDSALLRRLDLHVLLPLTFLYLISFLDRSNIGNAKLDGLTTDLNIIGSEYNIALMLWFVGYVIFEIPSNIILKKLNPKIWMPTLTLVWGIVAVCQGLVHNKEGLYAVRFFLGVCESGLFPGSVYIFSLFYPRKLRPFRVAFFFSGAALAGAFGGILAFGLGKIHAGVVALAAYYFVPKYPEQAAFLKPAERETLLQALRDDADPAEDEAFAWVGVRQALGDPFVWGYAMLFHGYSYCLYTITLFSPTIIKNLGYATWRAQLLTTPPYAIAFFFTMSTVYLSYKYNCRAPFIIGCAFLAALGYVVTLSTSTPAGNYVGLILTIMGVYSGNALVLSWPSENIGGQTKRATGLAMQISIGNLGAIVGTLVYRPSLNAHLFRTPNIIALAYIISAILAAGTLWYFMRQENNKRDALGGEAIGSPNHAKAGLQERRRLGDRHPSWRYQL